MAIPLEDIKALLENEEKIVRAREAAEDAKNGDGGRRSSQDRYTADREANDKRRSQKSGEGDSGRGHANGVQKRVSDGTHTVTHRVVPEPLRERRLAEPMLYGGPEHMAMEARVKAEQSSKTDDAHTIKPDPMEVDSYVPSRADDNGRRREGDRHREDRRRAEQKSRGTDRYIPDQERPTSSGSKDSKDSKRSGGDNDRRERRGSRSRSPRRRDPRPRRSRSPRLRRGSDDDRYPPREYNRGPRRSSPRGGRGGGGRRGAAGGPPPSDDERDSRTVFVQQLANRVRTREMEKFFEAAGEVVEAQIVKDRVSGRSKGVGYVEFRHQDSVAKAIDLTGQKLCGIPIIVAHTEAEKNRQVRNTDGSATQTNGVPFHRLYVGNIHFSITEEDLRLVFEPFGQLEFVQLQKEEHTGRSKGYGFVQYAEAANAKEALEKMNGFELANRAIRVGLGNDKFTNESTQNLLRSQAPQFTGSSFSGAGGRGAQAGGTGNFDRAGGRDAEKSGGASALDDTDVGGVNFSNYSRDSLMRKLARTEDPEPKQQPKTTKPKAQVTQAPASRCILVKNMFDQKQETEPNWQEELRADVKEECTDKYGMVKHVGLALDNDEGEVYVKFDRPDGGKNALRGLNGRYFGGRMLSADYISEAMYDANFPKAKNL